MQLSTFDTLKQWDLTGKKVLISISGGINSAAVACYVKKFVSSRPKELHLFYADFDEHSPGTLEFVHDIYAYCQKHFENVTTNITKNSVLGFFRESNMIPAPAFSPCTRILKRLAIDEYMENNEIDIDLIGYVRTEDRRIVAQIGKKLKIPGKLSRAKLTLIHNLLRSLKSVTGKNEAIIKKELLLQGVKSVEQAELWVNAYFDKVSVDGKKAYPISHMDNEDCFSLVKSELGWYPYLYDLKWDDKRIPAFFEQHKNLLTEEQATRLQNKLGGGGRIFHHNNCLPCKNMQSWEFLMVKLFFPEFYKKAIELQMELDGPVWGREADSLTTAELTCSYCTFD